MQQSTKKGTIELVGGGIAAVLSVVLAFFVPQEQAVAMSPLIITAVTGVVQAAVGIHNIMRDEGEEG